MSISFPRWEAMGSVDSDNEPVQGANTLRSMSELLSDRETPVRLNLLARAPRHYTEFLEVLQVEPLLMEPPPAPVDVEHGERGQDPREATPPGSPLYSNVRSLTPSPVSLICSNVRPLTASAVSSVYSNVRALTPNPASSLYSNVRTLTNSPLSSVYSDVRTPTPST